MKERQKDKVLVTVDTAKDLIRICEFIGKHANKGKVKIVEHDKINKCVIINLKAALQETQQALESPQIKKQLKTTNHGDTE